MNDFVFEVSNQELSFEYNVDVGPLSGSMLSFIYVSESVGDPYRLYNSRYRLKIGYEIN